MVDLIPPADGPSLPSRPITTADLAALLLAMLFPTVASYFYFIVLDGSVAIRWVYLSCKILQFAFPVLWIGYIRRRRMGTTPVLLGRGVPLGILFGLGTIGLTFLVYFAILRHSPLLAGTGDRIREKLSHAGLDRPQGFILLGVFLSVLHSALEEYYWRWYVYGELRRGVPPGIALVVSGLAFSSHHVIILAVYLPGEYFWTLTMGLSSAVAFGGIFWAWLYQRTRTLLGPWLSHALVDAGLMCVGYDLLFA